MELKPSYSKFNALHCTLDNTDALSPPSPLLPPQDLFISQKLIVGHLFSGHSQAELAPLQETEKISFPFNVPGKERFQIGSQQSHPDLGILGKPFPCSWFWSEETRVIGGGC